MGITGAGMPASNNTTVNLGSGNWTISQNCGSVSTEQMYAGPTYWLQAVPMEFDVGCDLGCSVLQINAVQSVLLASHANAGTRGNDTAFVVGAQIGSGASWAHGLGVGGGFGWWGIDNNAGDVIGTNSFFSYGGPSVQAGWGVRLSKVNFGTASIAVPGLKIGPDGTHYMGGGTIGATATGLAIGGHQLHPDGECPNYR